MKKRLYKSEKNKMFCGVCSGIAEYFGWDPTIVRLLFVIICLIKGIGIILYLLAAIIMPSGNLRDGFDTENLSDEEVEKMKSAHIDEEAEKASGDAPHSDEEFDSFFKKAK